VQAGADARLVVREPRVELGRGGHGEGAHKLLLARQLGDELEEGGQSPLGHVVLVGLFGVGRLLVHLPRDEEGVADVLVGGPAEVCDDVVKKVPERAAS